MEPEYHCEVDEGLFVMTFVAPKQLLLNPEWKKLVHNECLDQAWKRGIITTGGVTVEYDDLEKALPSELKEGETLKERMERYMATRGRHIVAASFVQVDLMEVRAYARVEVAM
jgi:hypothetical protein